MTPLLVAQGGAGYCVPVMYLDARFRAILAVLTDWFSAKLLMVSGSVRFDSRRLQPI